MKKANLLEKVKNRLKTYYVYLIILLSALFVFSVVRSVFRVFEAKQRTGQASEKVEKLKQENEELQRKLAEVKGEPYQEKQLRDKLGLAKEGEIVIVLPDKEILRKIVPVINEEEDTLPDPTWKKWLKLFY